MAGFELGPTDDPASYWSRRRHTGGVEYVQPVSRYQHITREYWFELLMATMAIAGMVELVVGRNSPGAPSSSLWFSIPAIGVLVLPLFFRRRFPFAAPATYWLLAAALTYVDGVLISFVSSLGIVGLATAFLLGNLRDGMKGGIGLAIVTGSIVIVVHNIPGGVTNSEMIFITLRFVAAWVAGYALRERSQQAEAAEIRAIMAEREREAAARIAVAEERARIARELHDVVAHSMSVMVLQIGAVRHKLPAVPADDREALGRVELAGRTALAEMRHLLGAMRSDGDEVELAPQPGLDGLDSLVEDVGRAGLPVRVHVDGEPFALPRALDLSAYRIVQEGLTNALKHARATRAEVTVGYGPNELRIEIRDNGRGLSATDGLGHGLVGIGERVKIYGGEMTTGTANGGGFVLSTRLPIRDAA
jgi:signal transduction histidine kinase